MITRKGGYRRRHHWIPLVLECFLGRDCFSGDHRSLLVNSRIYFDLNQGTYRRQDEREDASGSWRVGGARNGLGCALT